jgi:two-component system, NarL family, response regulator DesR
MSQPEPSAGGLTCLIADDHRALVKMLAKTLEDCGLSVVGRVTDGDQALARIAATRPDVAVVDLKMPGLPAGEIVRRTALDSPETAILIYTGNGTDAHLEEALACGARGVIHKEACLDELIQAIETVASGGAYVDTFQPGLFARVDGNQPPTPLSRRERDFLQLLAEGLCDGEIAKRLALRPDVVRSSARSAMKKLGAATRSQAVAKAVRLGLIA